MKNVANKSADYRADLERLSISDRKLLDKIVKRTKVKPKVKPSKASATLRGVDERSIPMVEPKINSLEKKHKKNTISADDLMKQSFKTMTIGGKFRQLLGVPYNPCYIMVYGSRFNGKSSVAMLLAQEFSNNGYKSLYIANEEGCKGALQEKVVRLKIHGKVDFVEDFDTSDFLGYDVILIDSIQTVGLKPEQFKELKKRFPQTSFILVCKANRDGSSKGGTDWEHDVDAIMHIEDRAGRMEKNRFAGGSDESIKFF